LKRGRPGTIGVVVPDLARESGRWSGSSNRFSIPASLLPGHHKAHSLVNLRPGEPLTQLPTDPERPGAACGSTRQENDWQALSSFVRDPVYLWSGDGAERTRERWMLRCGEQAQCGFRWPICTHARAASTRPVRYSDAAWKGWCKRVRRGRPTKRPAQWSRGFSAELTALGWPGERVLDSTEYQRWKHGRMPFPTSPGRISSPAAWTGLGRFRCCGGIAGETMFQPQGGEAPVQVLGVLEASGLQFDHLWVMGLHDEAWPGPPAPNPFCRSGCSANAGIPRCSPERELAFARLITDRFAGQCTRML